ncbi:MAG: LamG domain-containing protein [bacterium]|nr:LamG domain-containing protein [bacterium]
MRNLFEGTGKCMMVTWVILLILGGEQVAAAYPSSGLVGAYLFNGNPNDSSGNGNHGTLYGATTPITDRFGNANSAYRFNGKDDYIAVPGMGFSSSSFTVSAWVRVSTAATGGRDFVRRGNHANYVIRTVNTVDHVSGLSFAYSADPPPNYVPNWIYADNVMLLNQWKLVTGLYDRDQGMTRLYVDCALVGDNPGALDPHDPGGSLEIGNWYGTRNSWNYPAFVGDVDDVLIYNRALSDLEIQSLCSAVIGLAKQAGTTTDHGDGTFTVPITLTVENLGDVQLSGVQVTDDLTSTFPAGVTFSVVNPSATGGLTVNTGFNGGADVNLLLGTDTLAVGATATVSFDLTFNPGGVAGPFANSALASGQHPGATVTTDTSDDGSDPDPDGDGNPDEAGENDPTPISFAASPIIGAAKDAAVTGQAHGTTFLVTFTITVANLGNVELSGVQVVDDLAVSFAGASAFSIATLSSPTLTVNPGFDGTSDLQLFSGTDVLPVGGIGTVALDVQVTPGSNPGPYGNTATAMASSPGGIAVVDASQPGTDPDPDGDGDPTNNDAATSIRFQLQVLAIPTIGSWGLLLLGGLLAGLGARMLVRRRRRI